MFFNYFTARNYVIEQINESLIGEKWHLTKVNYESKRVIAIISKLSNSGYSTANLIFDKNSGVTATQRNTRDTKIQRELDILASVIEKYLK